MVDICMAKLHWGISFKQGGLMFMVSFAQFCGALCFSVTTICLTIIALIYFGGMK